MSAGAHDHGHAPGAARDGGPGRARQRRAVRGALVANAAFMVVEVAGGLLFGSLALLADAAHMLADVAGLAIALVAQRLVERPASVRHSYGLQRAEVLGAQANGVLLVAAAGWVLVEATRRIGEAPDVQGAGMLAVATAGLAVNVGSAVVLARAAGTSLNMRGTLVHMLSDAAGSAGAILAAVAVLAWDAEWADPAVSAVVALLVVWAAWALLRDATHVLLEGVPRNLRPDVVEAALRADDAVDEVHHLHLWNLASDTPALSAHVVLRDDVTLHQAQAHGDRLKAGLRQRFAIEHATLELECHACEADGHD